MERKSINNEWLLKKKLPKKFFKPRMSHSEIILFNKVASTSSTILEYGSGGSTITLIVLKKRIYSVDSNLNFYQFMLSINMIRRYLRKRLTYLFVDIGPTDAWGCPLTNNRHQSWSDYYKKIWEFIEKDSVILDLIFIDGRFRVACTLYAIKKILYYGWETKFLIHDFEREYYHIVQNFLDVIECTDTLYYFKLKRNININDIETYLCEYQDNYE